MAILLGIFEEGLIYAIMALGVYITYKILDFPDLSVDGTFPLGAALTAGLIVKGISPVWALPLSFFAGVLAGCVTGFIHVKCKVRDLFSGIIVMTALYSVNLRIAGMKANLPFLSQDTIFDNEWTRNSLPASVRPYIVVIILAVITLICKFVLDWYLNTRSGYLLRAAGDNRSCDRERLRSSRRRSSCSEAGLLRYLHRNRNHGLRSRKRHPRNPAVPSLWKIKSDHRGHRRRDPLQGMRRFRHYHAHRKSN